MELSACFALAWRTLAWLAREHAVVARWLPRAGRWMELVKIAFGVAFLWLAIWMLERILEPVWIMFLAGILVHIGQGPMQIEMHFSFFALIACLADEALLEIAGPDGPVPLAPDIDWKCEGIAFVMNSMYFVPPGSSPLTDERVCASEPST